jgi:hypothetical protein
MSMETLESDLKSNLALVAALQPELATSADVVRVLKETWAFIENHVAETGAIDLCVQDLLRNAEDILQPETAEIFAAVVTGGLAVAAALKTKISRDTDAQLYKVAEELERNCKKAEEILEEIVIDVDDDDDDDEYEDDDEDDEGDVEDDDEDSEGDAQ